MADSIATLAWLGNQAALEIHPWTSRIEAPGEPRWALVDIDPGERTTWDETLEIARLYRRALEHLGVIGVPKVTGKRGIQVFIPLRPGYTYEQTRAWVEQISRAVGGAVPDLVSWEWSKGQRGGRARLGLHPELAQPDARRTVLAATCARPPGLHADHLGRARRSGAPSRSLDDPHGPATARRAGRPLRCRAATRAGAARALIAPAGPVGPAGDGPRPAARGRCRHGDTWPLPRCPPALPARVARRKTGPMQDHGSLVAVLNSTWFASGLEAGDPDAPRRAQPLLFGGARGGAVPGRR